MVNVNPTVLTVEAVRLRDRANDPKLSVWERDHLLDMADRKVEAVDSFYADMRENEYPYATVLTEAQLTWRQTAILVASLVVVGGLIALLVNLW